MDTVIWSCCPAASCMELFPLGTKQSQTPNFVSISTLTFYNRVCLTTHSSHHQLLINFLLSVLLGFVMDYFRHCSVTKPGFGLHSTNTSFPHWYPSCLIANSDFTCRFLSGISGPSRNDSEWQFISILTAAVCCCAATQWGLCVLVCVCGWMCLLL